MRVQSKESKSSLERTPIVKSSSPAKINPTTEKVSTRAVSTLNSPSEQGFFATVERYIPSSRKAAVYTELGGTGGLVVGGLIGFAIVRGSITLIPIMAGTAIFGAGCGLALGAKSDNPE